MICGFCSREQAVKNECSSCGMALTRDGKKTGHWEGGKGTRNKSSMNKNDPKKFTGLSKTVSKKK